MSVDDWGSLSGSRRLEALRDKFQDRYDLFPRDVKLFHDFLDAQILQVLDHRGNGQPGILEHPRAADLAGNAFHGVAL